MDIIEAHKFCFANKKMLEKENKCGCFYCCEVFSPTEIMEWVESDTPDWTAICPYCGVDSVISESVGYPLSKKSLMKMREYWF